MNEKAYNTYIKMIRLACNNVKTEICEFNMFKGDEITVKVRGKDNLVELVEQIVNHAKSAVTMYSSRVDKYLVVRSTEPMIRMLTASEIFVESIISSRDARIAQKKLVEYGAMERYFNEAYLYDTRHKYSKKSDSAIEKAKKVITEVYTLSALSAFDFKPMRPCLDSDLRKSLEMRAYDKRFSFLDKTAVDNLIQKKYASVFAGRLSAFAMPPAQTESSARMAKTKESLKRIPIQARETPLTSKTLLLTDLYKGIFADLPLVNRRRKFINLKVRHNDILISPRPVLLQKKQFAAIESKTKHKYILDFYFDQMPSEYDNQDKSQYLFKQENKMYKHMWGFGGSVHYKQGRLYFPDGTNMVVPREYAPHEFFHKVNTTYAALFGFRDREDSRGGREWLYDAIRKAYTDEGMADYRLAMIDAKLSGKLK